MAPLAVSANKVSAWARESAWVILVTRSLSQRSATAPAIGPRSMVGKRSAKATRPSQAPDWVSCQVSQPVATRCIQNPTSEIELPAV